MKNRDKKRGWGDGAIDELPSGRFRARGSIVSPSGERQRVARTFDSLDAARSWLASLRVEKDRGAVVVASSLTLAQWCGEWLLVKKSSTGAGNFRNYDDQLRIHVLPHLGAVKLRDLTAARLKKWLADLDAAGLSASMRRKAAATLSTVLADAVAEGKLAANPLKGKAVKRPPATKAAVEVWTADELRRFLAAATPSRLFPVFQLLADTGCRPGEALGLHWPDVDLDGGTIRIRRAVEQVGALVRLKEPKTKAGNRTISLSAETVRVLAEHKRQMEHEEKETGSGLVFVPRASPGPYTRETVRAAFSRAAVKAKLPRRKLYALRHTSATLLLSAGVNVRTVSRRLGHEDIAVTLRHYAGWLPDDDTRAAEAMQQILSGEGGKSKK